MILTDKDIINRANNMGRPLTKPFDEKHVTPNGYDLSIKEVELKIEALEQMLGLKHEKHILNINDEDIVIPGKTFCVGMTEERVEMPANVVGFLWIRSSYGRKGLILMASVVDAGYCGNLALSMYNCSEDPIVIEKNGKRTICQIVFEQLDSTPSALYAQRSGHYQNQKSLKE
jgi:dCTP deaminase